MKHIAILLIIVFDLVPVIFGAPKVFACSCSEPRSPSEAFQESTAVFTGKVINVRSDDYSRTVQFDVDRAWKGVSQRTSTLATAGSDASCGYDFKEGTSYVVYAHGSKESLEASLCSRTTPVADAYEDLAYLGEGYVPVAGQPVIEKTPSSPFLPFIGIGAIVAGVIAFITLRSRRP